jgi:hypothetical protein
MEITDLIKIVILFILIALIIFTYIYYTQSIKKSNLFNNEDINVNPATISEKKKCVSNRTECNPADPESCNNSCTETELTCVKLQDYTPTGGNKINGGGYVCLPEIPNINCNKNRGGVLAWTGYSVVDKQGWSCLCMYPDRFNGDDCSQVAPAFCTGGTVDTNNLKGAYPDNSVCKCPEGKTLLINSYNNLPFCADNKFVGNIKLPPSWYNIYFNTDYKNQNKGPNAWATDIANEIFWNNPLGTGTSEQFVKDVNDILTNGNNGFIPINKLYLGDDQKVSADLICSKACFYNTKPDSKMCDCNNNKATPGSYPSKLEANEIIYTYYQGANYPDS